jgi:hypothetical protein
MKLLISSPYRVALVAFGALALAGVAYAGGVIENYCLSKGEPETECSCSQTVADETLSPADQQRFVTIADDPAAFFAIAAEPGGEVFLGRVTAFADGVEQRCE